MPNSLKSKILFTSLVMIFATTPLLNGCGKRGWPQPANTNDSFQWLRASAKPENGCMRIDAELSGNLRNVDYITLELQTAGTAEDCPTCPFNPNERTEFTPEQLGMTSQIGAMSTSYCPKRQSSAYRWRLIGVNIHSSLENVISSVHSVEMK